MSLSRRHISLEFYMVIAQAFGVYCKRSKYISAVNFGVREIVTSIFFSNGSHIVYLLLVIDATVEKRTKTHIHSVESISHRNNSTSKNVEIIIVKQEKRYILLFFSSKKEITKNDVRIVCVREQITLSLINYDLAAIVPPLTN